MECCNAESTSCSTVEPRQTSPSAGPGESSFWIRLAVAALFVGNSMVVGLAINVSDVAADTRIAIEIALLAVTVIVACLVARPLLQNFWKSLKQRQVSFEFLFVTGIFGSMGVSIASMIRGAGPIYFEVASLLLVIYALGDRIGAVSKRRSLEVARSWLDENPTCRIENDGGATVEVPLNAVSSGQTALIFAGEEIPVDGTVLEGRAFVQSAQVTGESRPIVVRKGDQVLAGSHVVDASLRIQVRAGAGERAIDDVAARVRRAWERPSNWQQTANRLVRYFFPIVAGLTVATFVGWTAASGWEAGLMNALSVLLVACPCAMGFAVPLAIWMSLGQFARRGLVGRSGDVVERLAEADTVIFDKTGTLTAGSEHLVDIVVNERFDRPRILEIIGAVEATSNHPIARAFQTSPLLPDDFRFHVLESRYIAGEGIEARGAEFSGGSHEVFIGEVDTSVTQALESKLRENPSARRTTVLVDGDPAAMGLVDEEALPGVHELEDQLSALGLRTVLLTGDTRDRAARFGISEHRADMSPEAKADFVDELTNNGAKVLFVGDGINDAGAMASSHVSVARASGSELTVEVADMTWHGNDPTILPEAIGSARESVGLIRQNLYYAAAYNLVGIAAAASGFLHPVLAAVIMVASSLFVTWRTVWALDPTATHDPGVGRPSDEVAETVPLKTQSGPLTRGA